MLLEYKLNSNNDSDWFGANLKLGFTALIRYNLNWATINNIMNNYCGDIYICAIIEKEFNRLTVSFKYAFQ